MNDDFDWDKDFTPTTKADESFEWNKDFVPDRQQPGALESAARGARQGASLGFSDELGGAVEGGLQGLANALPKGALEWAGIDNRYQQGMGDTYRRARDEERTTDDAAREAHPGAYVAGSIAGGLVPGAIAGPSLGASAALGAASGLGMSKADSIGGMAGDAALGAGAGLVAHGAGALAGRALRAPLSWAQRGFRSADDALRAGATGQVDSAIASQMGSLGQARSAANRAVENVDRLRPDMDPFQAGIDQQLSPEIQALKSKLIDSSQDAIPGHMATIEGKEGVLSASMSGRQGAIDSAYASASSPMAAIKPAFQSAVRKLIGGGIGGVVGSQVGGAIAGSPGAYVGGGIGATLGAGSSGNPAARRLVYDGLTALFRAPEMLGRYARPLAEAYSRGGERALAARHFILQQSDPEYRQMVQRLDQGD